MDAEHDIKLGRIEEKLDHQTLEITLLKEAVKAQNGRVSENEKQIIGVKKDIDQIFDRLGKAMIEFSEAVGELKDVNRRKNERVFRVVERVAVGIIIAYLLYRLNIG